MMIYHIYWGTSGNAGLYIDEIYNALKSAGFSQRAFVSYYYPFDYGEKFFFKRSEMEHCKYNGHFRKLLQAFELIVALCRILLVTAIDKPRIVNYSYVSRGNIAILIFLKLLKRISGCRLIITCHDVIPYIEKDDAYKNEILIKKKIFAIADYFLVHTDSSKRDLKKLFDIDEEQILMHIFPLMDLSKVDHDNSDTKIKYDFLFVGHMRQEKGIPLLVDAWEKFHAKYSEARLCIAGNPNYYEDYLEKHKEWCKDNNIELLLGFIKDKDYIRIVKASQCVVFPYTGGTNSGVISTVISLGKDVITSDIGMFANNPFVHKGNMFISGDVDSLADKLIQYKNGTLISYGMDRIAWYRIKFNDEVKLVYEKVLKNLVD